MSRARQPPLVTGISPNEGAPWTKVTIRGENLGTGPNDLIGLSICGHNCLLTAEWMSASKIVCRVGPAKDDKGEIIVTTRSGGQGTSTVSFKLLKPERIGILDQSAVWLDELNYYDMRTDRNKGISPLSLRPANPLGIEIDKGKVPLKDLENMFPSMSGDFTSENFSATWYLIENHSSTSFEQLRAAVGNLKKQASKKNEGSLAYVKGGLSTFFEAQDALAAIHQKLESDGTEKVEGSMTQRLENVLNRASETADTLFQEVLGRKDKADSTRNALNVLQRFKFLFNLPLNIERNIQKGDYDVVINDYEKAKSLFGNTEVPVFKKVYSEVETRIEALRKLLLDKLLETPSTLHDQKRYIRYLSDLHAPGDPAWQCIVAQHKWILQLMQNCKEDLVKEQKVGGVGLELDRSSALNRISLSAPVKRGGSFQTPKDDSWHYKSPQQVRFVEKLSDVVISQLPNFWKLWISYVNGSLFSETGEKSGQVEKLKKNARQRQNDFKVIYTRSRLVSLSEIPISPVIRRDVESDRLKGNMSAMWMLGLCSAFILSHEALSALEIPNDLLQVIQDLLQDLRVHCLLTTLQHTEEDVKRLAEKEDWVVDNEGITSLPAQFEQCMVQMLQSLKEPMECKPGEINVQIFTRHSSSALPLQIIWSVISFICVCLFVLRSLIWMWFKTNLVSSLLCVCLFWLINCQYLERHTFLNLAEHLEKNGFTTAEKIIRVSIEALRQLDEYLFETYIEKKSDPIVGSLESGIYAGYFDWKDCLPPTGNTHLNHVICMLTSAVIAFMSVSVMVKCVCMLIGCVGAYLTPCYWLCESFVNLQASCVRSYLKEALVSIISVHAEVRCSNLQSTNRSSLL
uniref:Exocyst complex component 2 n=1 Tax=Sinocyclocheilus grahami TaxID=75366 RepID=A0A672R7R6_SINGR